MTTQSSIQLIRNATVVFNYAGKKFLIDPMLAPKGMYPGFPGTVNSHLNNPLVDLPVSPDTLLDADAIIVTHLHPDHWDQIAAEKLPKDIPVFAQNEEDAKIIGSYGFLNVSAMADNTIFEGVFFQKTYCQHGSDQAYSIPEVAEVLGSASGLFFKCDGEKSVYFLGDTIWIEQVETNLKDFRPDIVVINAGMATLEGLGPIIMGKEDVVHVNEILPDALIVPIHLETVNHCVLSRRELQEFVNDKGIEEKVIIPEDGQIIEL